MKAHLIVLAVILMLNLGCSTPHAQERYRIADTSQAKKYAAWHGGEFRGDFGDSNGPYEAVAKAVVSSDATSYHFAAHVDDHIADFFPDIRENNRELHVYYFVNPKGNCYGVIQTDKKD